MKRDWFFLYLIIISLCVSIISVCFITDIFQLGISYQLEQIFWFLSTSSLAIFYLSCILGFVLFQEKKVEPNNDSLSNKNIFRKIVNYWYLLLWISISIMVFDALILGYLKSLLSLDVFNTITKINHPVWTVLYIIIWIGAIILIISALSFIYYSVKKES